MEYVVRVKKMGGGGREGKKSEGGVRSQTEVQYSTVQPQYSVDRTYLPKVVLLGELRQIDRGVV